MLCLSHDGTNKYLDVLGEGYDQEVCNWKNKIFALKSGIQEVKDHA